MRGSVYGFEQLLQVVLGDFSVTFDAIVLGCGLLWVEKVTITLYTIPRKASPGSRLPRLF